MTIDQHINITVRVNNAGIARQGFGTIGVLGYTDAFPELSRTYRRLADLIADGVASDSPIALAVSRILSQSPHPTSVKVLRGTRPPTQVYTVGVADVELGKEYAINVKGEGVEETEVSYTTLADLTFTAANASETLTSTAHGMETGDGPYRLSNAGGALPTGLSADTNYWIIKLTADTYQLAATRADAIAETEATFTTDGTGTHTLRRNQNDVIIAQLVQGLNDVVGKNFTAAQVPGTGETDTMTVTADEAGAWFSLALLDWQIDNLEIAQTHTNPGIEDDLSDIVLVDNDWYYLHTSFNSEEMVKDAAEWIEAQQFKAYVVDVCDTASEDDAAGGGDVLDDLEGLGYKRTLPCFHRDPSEMFAAGIMGRLAPLNVGTWTAAYKTIIGCTADRFTATQIANLDAKKATYYKSEAGRSITWEGKVANQEYGFFDVTVALDFVLDDIQKSAFGVFVAMDKVAYTDEDIAVIRGAIEGALDRAKSDAYKIIAPGTPDDPDDPEPSVSFPRVADIDPSVRALRQLPDGNVNFRLQGAVHTVDIDLTVTF